MPTANCRVMRLAGKQLPYPGGFDKDGNLTSDPGAIEESMRILPTGYWKGSGMALVLDMAAAMLSGGRSGDQMDDEGARQLYRMQPNLHRV